MAIQESHRNANPDALRLPGLSILVPAYNEEASLESVVDDLLAVVPKVALESEILIIDDGSTDQTPAIADRLSASHSGVRAIHHPRNLGFGAVQRTGFSQTKLPFITLVPGDGQFPASDLSRFLPYAGEADIVLGYRTHRADSLQRRLQTAVFRWVTHRMLGLNFRDINWVKLYRREAITGVEIRSRKIGADAEVLVQVLARGGRVREVEVSYVPRQSGVASGARLWVVFQTVVELLRIWLHRIIGKIS